jgi:hypothetical protein
MYKSLGLGPKKAKLKTDAIPTIFERPASSRGEDPESMQQPPHKKKRLAYEKRERMRVQAVYHLQFDFVTCTIFDLSCSCWKMP